MPLTTGLVDSGLEPGVTVVLSIAKLATAETNLNVLVPVEHRQYHLQKLH